MREAQTESFYILSLDGGGSLGVYTLGVLEQVERLVKKPLHEQFNLFYGTSTGSIISSLLALGKSINEISEMYFKYIPDIMSPSYSSKRSEALKQCANDVFGERRFDDKTFKQLIGVVATNYDSRSPMIFKSSVSMFEGGSGDPGFGCKISDAIVASCSASPFFDRHKISTSTVGEPEMIDGGFVANNPTLFAIIDAAKALEKPEGTIKVLNVGVGNYLRSNASWKEAILRIFASSPLDLFQTTLTSNSNAINNLRQILFRNVSVVRISDSRIEQNFATNLLESNREKLQKIKEFGIQSSINHQYEIEELFNIRPSS